MADASYLRIIFEKDVFSIILIIPQTKIPVAPPVFLFVMRAEGLEPPTYSV